MTRTIEVERVSRDEGTIVAFVGTDIETGDVVEFAVDHRMAQPIAEHLTYHAHEEPTVAEIENWQVLRVTAAEGATG